MSRQFSVRVALAVNVNVEALASVWSASTANIEAIKATSLLMQAVVSPGVKTEAGMLIQAVTLPWFEIVRLLAHDPSQACQIPSRKWEEIVAGASDFAPKLREDALLKPYMPARLELVNGEMLISRLQDLANTEHEG